MEILPIPLNLRNHNAIGCKFKVAYIVAANALLQELESKGMKTEAIFTIKSIDQGNYSLEIDGVGEVIIESDITSRIFNIKI